MGIEYIDKTHAKLVVTRGSGANRTRRVKRITYINKKDAERQYKAFERSVSFNVDNRMTVDDLLKWYITQFDGKPTTKAGYESAQKAIFPVLGKRKAADITLPDIDRFLAVQAKRYAPKTIKNQLSLLSAAYKSAIRRGILSNDPCHYAQPPRQKKPDIVTLNDADFQKFIIALDNADPYFRVMCELALFCGLRRSEILGLKKEDVSDTVTIDKVRHRVSGKDVIETPKTASSFRTLAVPEFIQNHIKDLPPRVIDSGYLIQGDFGEPATHWWVRSNLERLILDNGLPQITMHGLRHTYASMLITKGVPIAEVSMQLGHSSIDITLRTYTHLFNEASTASRRISALMEGLVAPNGHQEK